MKKWNRKEENKEIREDGWDTLKFYDLEDGDPFDEEDEDDELYEDDEYEDDEYEDDEYEDDRYEDDEYEDDEYEDDGYEDDGYEDDDRYDDIDPYDDGESLTPAPSAEDPDEEYIGDLAPAAKAYDKYDDFDDDFDDYDDGEESFADDYDDEDYEEYTASRRESAGFSDWLSRRTPADYAILFGGILAAGLFIVLCVFFFGKIDRQKQFELMADVGNDMEQMNVIGGSGLLAMADVRKDMVAEIVEEEIREAEEADEKEIVDENRKKVAVMNLTSIQKDLKIKIVDNELGKLISGIEFEVEITDPNGKSSLKTDNDLDGIIYLTDLTAGKYQVALKGPEDGDYSFSKDAISINVKGTIEYKKVEIKDEIKTEKEINAAVEDTQQKTETESELTDTVEYVESTKTIVEGTEREEYQEVPRDKIADPGKTAFLGMKQLGKKHDPDGDPDDPDDPDDPGDDPTDDPTEDPTPTPEESPEPTDPPQDDPTPDPTSTPTSEPTDEPDDEPTPEATPTKTPTAEPDDPITEEATPTKTPTAEPTATPKDTDATPTITPTVTPTVTPTAKSGAAKAKEDKTSILKTTDGTELYVKDDAGYRKAVYADYYDKALKFYKKVTSGEYRYTGWQVLDGYRYFFDKEGRYVTGEQVIQGAKYVFDADGKLSNGSGVLGIDVSKWNGSIDWDAVKNSGVSFVIIRCGYRGSKTGALVEDPMFHSNIRGAQSAGLKVGIYFFSQAVNEVEAVEEASMVLSLIGGYNISYPVYLDVEGSGGRGDSVSVDTRTAVCQAFCKTIQNSGYKAGIYANKTWFSSHINTPSLTGFKLWLAQYAAVPTYTRTRYDMWQYSSNGSVSGIGGRVDMNISYLGY